MNGHDMEFLFHVGDLVVNVRSHRRSAYLKPCGDSSCKCGKHLKNLHMPTKDVTQVLFVFVYRYSALKHSLIYLKWDKNCHIRIAGPNWSLLGNPLLFQRFYLKLFSFPRAEPSAFSDCSVENLPVHYVLSYMRTSLTYDKEPFPPAAVYMWKEEERFKHFLLSDESPVHCFIIN